MTHDEALIAAHQLKKYEPERLAEMIMAADALNTYAGTMRAGMRATAGKDQYVYHGSMNTVEDLTAAQNDFEFLWAGILAGDDPEDA